MGLCNYPATITRPDIAYTTTKLSEHLRNPGPQHFTAIDRCLAYLNFTRFKALEFNGKPTDKPIFETATDTESIENHLYFKGYSDASFADDTETRRST